MVVVLHNRARFFFSPEDLPLLRVKRGPAHASPASCGLALPSAKPGMLGCAPSRRVGKTPGGDGPVFPRPLSAPRPRPAGWRTCVRPVLTFLAASTPPWSVATAAAGANSSGGIRPRHTCRTRQHVAKQCAEGLAATPSLPCPRRSRKPPNPQGNEGMRSRLPPFSFFRAFKGAGRSPALKIPLSPRTGEGGRGMRVSVFFLPRNNPRRR